MLSSTVEQFKPDQATTVAAPRRRQEPEGTVEYRLTEEDQVYMVNRYWREFAQYNNAPELCDDVIGRSVWSFIDGDEVQAIYRSLFERVRVHSRPITFTIRCDAPERRRWLRVNLDRLIGGNIRFQTRLIHAEDRPYLPCLDSFVEPDPNYVLTMCAGCQRMRDSHRRQWLDPEVGLYWLGVFEHDVVPKISHGICESCRNRLTAHS